VAVLGQAEMPRVGAATKLAGRRLVLGVVISLAAVVGIAAALAKTTRTELVVGVRQPVALGQVISASDLTAKTISGAGGVDSVPASRLTEMVGRVARSPLYPGEILPSQAVSSGPDLPAGQAALTMALASEQAVGGMLQPGDQVAVLTTPTGLGTSTAATSSTVALPSVTVLSVATDQSVGSSEVLVTVEVASAQLTALDAAYRGGKVDLALVGGR
jgi:Flp pilus assembly protein CpaB